MGQQPKTNTDVEETKKTKYARKIPPKKLIKLWKSNRCLPYFYPQCYVQNICKIFELSLEPIDCKNSAAKQQTPWVVSLWQSPLTFVWPGVPKDCWMGLIGAPSDGDWNTVWRYFVSMRLYLAIMLYSRMKENRNKKMLLCICPPPLVFETTYYIALDYWW